MAAEDSVRTEVALFATCLVDLFRPNVGFAALTLLERARCDVVVPRLQTCCGQPAYNAGDEASAGQLARQVIEVFEHYTHIVVPSGSCAGMIREHYPKLLNNDPDWSGRARAVAAKTHELTAFLVDVMGMETVDAGYSGTVCYHDSCAGLRELGIKHQPRKLLAGVRDMNQVPLEEEEECCGFGGLFCVKYADISNAMVARKIKHVTAGGADTLVAGDLGCLLNMAGKLTRERQPVRVWHVAEILAGATGGPAIGEADRED